MFSQRYLRLCGLILILCLTGCSEWYAMSAGAKVHGAEIADQKLAVAIWEMCQAGTVGAVTRRFKTQAEREAWAVICKTEAPE